MTYITSEMQVYAEGYHDGRMEYDFDSSNIDRSLVSFYTQGYENGLDDRSEQDERA